MPKIKAVENQRYVRSFAQQQEEEQVKNAFEELMRDITPQSPEDKFLRGGYVSCFQNSTFHTTNGTEIAKLIVSARKSKMQEQSCFCSSGAQEFLEALAQPFSFRFELKFTVRQGRDGAMLSVKV